MIRPTDQFCPEHADLVEMCAWKHDDPASAWVSEATEVSEVSLDGLLDEVGSGSSGSSGFPGGMPGGEATLQAVESFLTRFVSYPGEHERVAHVLWIAHTWFMDSWESTPRIAFLSPEPGSGKSRALEVTEPLVPRAVHAVNATPAYLFRKVSDPDGLPTILFDEVDTIFGPKAKENEDLRGMLNAGHRKGATAGRCVIKGKEVTTEELPAYCAVALAGLDDLPDTIMTRSVVVRMKRRAPNERVEPWRRRLNEPDGQKIGQDLAAWADGAQHLIQWPDMPDGVEDRNADVWEPLLAVADLAGGDWPERARNAAIALVLGQKERGSLGVLLLRDLRRVFGDEPRGKTTVDILSALNAMDESPWTAFNHGAGMTPNDLAKSLARYDVHPKSLNLGGPARPKGYRTDDLQDSWLRYLPPLTPEEAATAATAATTYPVGDISGASDCDCPNAPYDQHRLDCINYTKD